MLAHSYFALLEEAAKTGKITPKNIKNKNTKNNQLKKTTPQSKYTIRQNMYDER